MTKTPKAYRDDLLKYFWAKRKDTNEKIKRIQDNPDFLEAHKVEAIKVVKDNLYKELDDARATEEYKDAKSKKQALRGKKKDVKKQEEIITEQKKLFEYKDAELIAMSEAYGEKIEKKESKETLTKSLEFEEYTFKISSKGWKEVTNKDKNDSILGKFVWKKPKVKANATWDVVEYLDGDAKWEQIFITYDAFIREVCKAKNCSQEVVESRYMMTIDEFQEKMKDKPDNSPEYKKFFNEEVKGPLAGFWNPDYKKFYDVGVLSHVWLVGGNNAVFNQSKSDWDNFYSDFGFSGRLLKN